jgi:hypothetical protein
MPKLTAVLVENVKPNPDGTDRRLPDGGNLYLLVNPAGQSSGVMTMKWTSAAPSPSANTTRWGMEKPRSPSPKPG